MSAAADRTPPQETGTLPTATIRPRRRFSWAWLLPAGALVLAAWLAARAWSQRGTVVTVQLDEGWGLKAGDEVRYRGIAVGEVRSVELDEQARVVRVTASLDAGGLARAGSRFWVVRPQFGLSRIGGLETLVGPRYLAVLPGRGPRQRLFVGLNEPPVVEAREPDDLEVILTASEKRSLRRGAPVMYRQIRVGTILSVGLTSDGGAVEARVHIDKPYTRLIRRGTRFWDVGGLEASVGLGGLTIRAETVETVIAGGVALATPPEAGEPVHTGHRFALEEGPPDDWLGWQPLAVIGNALLPPGAPLPGPLRATVGWKAGKLITWQRQRQGWVLQTAEGLLGPADLLAPDDVADPSATMIEVAGQVIPLDQVPRRRDGATAVLDVRLAGVPTWPAERRRRGREPEDCLAVGDPTAQPLPLAAARLAAGDDAWALDPALSVDESWHGAAVVARADGLLVGLLLVEDDGARVALLEK